jgi:MSHA biogenesis protein MshG
MIKHIEKAYFQMATLLDAGLPITRSLQIIAQGFRGRLKKTFTFLHDHVEQGSQLNEAMNEKRHFFDPLDVTMVAAAEESGNLGTTFKMLADWYELQVKIRRKILGGLAFPAFVLFIGVFAGYAPDLVLGSITGLQYLRICLTRLAVFAAIVAVPFVVPKIMPKRGFIRLPFDSFLLLVPLLRKPLYNLALARYCRCFYMLYSAGIPIVNAARLATDLTGNRFVSGLLKGAADSASAGEPMHKGFSRSFLPLEMLSLWEVGEESGKLDDATLHLAKMYQDKADFGFDVLAYWMPRIVYAFVSVYLIMMIFRNFAMISGRLGGF